MTKEARTHIGPDAQFQAFLDAGKFMLQKSRSSGKHVFYPRIAEPGSGLDDLEWVEASGRGTVYSTTVVRQAPPKQDYGVALVDLDEGVRLMSRVEGRPPADIRIGLRVRSRIQPADEGALLLFVPEQDAA